MMIECNPKLIKAQCSWGGRHTVVIYGFADVSKLVEEEGMVLCPTGYYMKYWLGEYIAIFCATSLN